MRNINWIFGILIRQRFEIKNMPLDMTLKYGMLLAADSS
jgi:hypothetical protein